MCRKNEILVMGPLTNRQFVSILAVMLSVKIIGTRLASYNKLPNGTAVLKFSGVSV